MDGRPGRPLGSPMVGALESAWQAIRSRHPDVPDAVIVVGAGSAGRQSGLKLGHFAALRWCRDDVEIPEVFVAGEGLQREPTEVLGTLLHEAAHGIAEVRCVDDTSRGGRYHNRRYAALGRELGLHIAIDGPRGWSGTTVPPETATAYSEELANLGGSLEAYRRPEAAGVAAGGRASSNNPTACMCECPRRIRVAPAVLAEGPIVCSVCTAEFTPAGG